MAEHDGDKAVAQENIAEQQPDHCQLDRTRADRVNRIQCMAESPNERRDQRGDEGVADDFFEHPDAE
ncbi:hypothetical protein D3C81_2107520 [compost metagenome]